MGGSGGVSHLVISLPFSSCESYLKISLHAFHALGRLQTYQKPLSGVSVLVVSGLRPNALATHLSRNAQGPTSGAPGRWGLRVSYRRWQTTRPL